MDIATLANNIKSAVGGLTGAQIKALDSSFLCQNPQLAYQQLKASGYQITVSTNADGTPLYKITA